MKRPQVTDPAVAAGAEALRWVVADALARWVGADDLNAEAKAAVEWHVAHLDDGAKRVLDAALPHLMAQGWTAPASGEVGNQK